MRSNALAAPSFDTGNLPACRVVNDNGQRPRLRLVSGEQETCLENFLPSPHARACALTPQTQSTPRKITVTYGRFASGQSVYQYVGGNPVTNVDPQGLFLAPAVVYVLMNAPEITAVAVAATEAAVAYFSNTPTPMSVSSEFGAMAGAGGQCSISSDLQKTLDRIQAEEALPFRNDGSVFENRENLLPPQSPGYYTEYVHPTPGISGPGAQRVVTGNGGEVYYTPDHYKTFIPIK
jgi:guanyl-specific ribonuclease Sa